MMQSTLLDDFSVNAAWIILTNDIDITNQSNYKFGTLEYKNGMSDLLLFQGWNPGYKKITAGMSLYRKRNILGIIANDETKYIYIPEISINPTQLGFSDFLVTYKKWYLNRFSVINFIPQGLSSSNFDELVISFDLLSDWITPSLKFINSNNRNLQTSIKSSGARQLAHFTYNGQLYDVKLIGNVNKSYGQNDKYINYKNDSWFLLIGENSISSNLAIYFTRELRKMLSVILGVPCNTTQLTKKGYDKKEEKILKEDIYFLEMQYEKHKKVNMNMGFKDYLDIQLNNLIPNWFKKGENFELLVQDYLLTISYNETVENKLINLTEGIEAYYRDKAESLCEKIKDMIYSLPQYIQDVLIKNIGNLDDWSLALKQTRVYFAHGDRKAHIIEDFEKLSQYVNVFQYLVQYFILQELGMKITSTDNVVAHISNFFYEQQI